MDKYILIMQKKSIIKQIKKNKILFLNLGLNKIRKKKFIKNNFNVKNMLLRIQHLISINKKYI